MLQMLLHLRCMKHLIIYITVIYCVTTIKKKKLLVLMTVNHCVSVVVSTPSETSPPQMVLRSLALRTASPWTPGPRRRSGLGLLRPGRTAPASAWRRCLIACTWRPTRGNTRTMSRPGGVAHRFPPSLGGAEEEEEGRPVECMRVSDCAVPVESRDDLN